jgi:hypothetical protein
MEIFPLMGEDYISNPEIGRIVHKKRFRFEKLLSESSMGKFKDGLFDALANAGIGRDMQIFAAKGRLTR